MAKPKDVSSKYIEGLKNYSKFILRVPEDVNMEIQKSILITFWKVKMRQSLDYFCRKNLWYFRDSETLGFVNLPQIPVVSIATLVFLYSIWIIEVLIGKNFGLGSYTSLSFSYCNDLVWCWNRKRKYSFSKVISLMVTSQSTKILKI